LRPRFGALLVLVALLAIAIGAGARMIRRGFSARDEPSALEAFVARRARALAVPASVKQMTNPVSLTPEVLAEARAHFADHCATCHANDGSGNTTIGRNLYPRAPDMRLSATQQLSDGEIYGIIQDGIRLTGMPGWGKAGDVDDEDSWKLVHLIRHLSELTPEQLKEMESMNPRSPAEIEEERQEREWLEGKTSDEPDAAKPKPPAHVHKQ